MNICIFGSLDNLVREFLLTFELEMGLRTLTLFVDCKLNVREVTEDGVWQAGETQTPYIGDRMKLIL